MNYNKINGFLNKLTINDNMNTNMNNNMNNNMNTNMNNISTLPLENPQRMVLNNHKNIVEHNDLLKTKEESNSKINSYNFLNQYQYINRTFDDLNFNKSSRIIPDNTINEHMNTRKTLTKNI